MNFICREDVIAILKSRFVLPEAVRDIESLPSFPAPNPDEKNNRNVMGQTEDKFWSTLEDEACSTQQPPLLAVG